MRKHYIDNLRWMIVLLLIPYHAAMAWNVWEEPNYIYFEGNSIISALIVFFSPYFMPLMFLIAGISAKFALQKRTIGQYVLERFKKLFVPFVFGTILIMPLMTYIADKFNYGYQGNILQHYSVFFTRFTDLTGSDGGFSVGHFWFILYLFFISLIAAGAISLQIKLLPEKKTDLSVPFLCLLGFPLPFLNDLLSIGGKSLAEYAYIFLIGYYIFSNEKIIFKAEKYKWFFLCSGLTATVFHVYMFIWSDARHALPNLIAKFVSEWFMMIALLGIGKKYLNFSGKISNHMSQTSYCFYIFHFIWVVLFQYILFPICGNHTFLLYAMPALLSYSATLLCCEISNKTRRYVSEFISTISRQDSSSNSLF